MTSGKVERLNDVPDVYRIKICCDKYGNYQGTLAPRDHTNILSYSSDELKQFNNLQYIYRPIDPVLPVGYAYPHHTYRPERQDNHEIRVKAWQLKTAATSFQCRIPTSEWLSFPQDVFGF